MATTYYSMVIDNPKHKNYMEKRSLHRISSLPEKLLTETWNGEGWEHDQNVLAATGLGGDNKYVKVSESEVDNLKTVVMERLKNKK